MHLLASVLACALALGPAPEVEAETGAPAPAEAEPEPSEEAPELPDLAPETVDEPEPEIEPEPEPQPEVKPEPPAPTIEETSESDPDTAEVLLVEDNLRCGGSSTCYRMTVTGIVLGSLGLVGVGTGAGLLARPDVINPELPIYMTSSRPAGLVTLTVSAGVTVTAILMIVAARKGYKQRGVARIEPIPGGLRF